MELNKIKDSALEWLIILAVFLPLITFAQISTVEDIGLTVARVINVFIAVFWTIVIAFGLWAAISYLIAGGDEDKIKTAHKRLVYLTIAITIAISLNVIRTVLENLVGGGLPSPQ